ncbi:uncharacterized protein LOC144945916 [Lampetra fluviatilis]
MRPKALNSPPRSHRVSGGGERTRVDLTMARMAGPLLGGTLLGLSASLSAALNLALLFQLQGAFRQQRCDDQHQHATEKQQQQQQHQQQPSHHHQQQQQHPPQTPQQQQFQDLLHHHEQLQQQHQYTEQQLQYPAFQPQQQLQQQQQPQQQTDESGNAAGAAAAIMRTSAMCLAAVALSLNLCCASICVIHALLASRMVHAHRAQRFVESTQKARLVTMALFCLALLSFTAALSLHAFLVLDVPAFLACAGALGCGVLLSASGLIHGLAAARRSAQLPARVPRAPATLMPPPPLPPPQQQHHQHQQHHHPQQHQQPQQQQPPGSGLQAEASACRPEPRARALSFWNQVALSEHGRSDDNGDDFTLAANDCAAAGPGGAAGEELCTLSASLPHPRHHQRVPPHNGRERFVDVPAESCGSRRKTASMSDIVAESRRQQPHQQQPHQQQQHQQQKQQQHQQQHHHHHQQQQPPPQQQHQQQQQRHHMDPLSLLSSKMAAAGGGCSGTATMGSRDRQGANQHGPVSGDARPWNGVTRELKAAQARWRLTDISNTTLV